MIQRTWDGSLKISRSYPRISHLPELGSLKICFILTRVKSGNFGQLVNSDIHLQSVEIQIRQEASHQDFTVCLVHLFSIPILKKDQTWSLSEFSWLSEFTWLPQIVQTLIKYRILLHFIWVSNVCQNSNSGKGIKSIFIFLFVCFFFVHVSPLDILLSNIVKLVLSGNSKIDKTKMTSSSLMKVKSIAKCSPWSILQNFWPALSDNWSWTPKFCLLFEWPLQFQ